MTEQLKNTEPAIGQVKIQTGSNNSDGFVKGLTTAALLPIGAIVFCSLLTGLIGFGLGAYVQTQRLKPDYDALAVAEAKNIKLENQAAHAATNRLEIVNELNAELGVKTSEADELISANSVLNKLLGKKTPPEIKYISTNNHADNPVQGEHREKVVNEALEQLWRSAQ